MAETIRTKAELIALYADNNTGDISAQDLRDLVETIFQPQTRRVQATAFGFTTGSSRPTPGAVGPTNYFAFDVNDEGWYHVTLPPDIDIAEDVIIHVDWAPAAAAAAKTVSWELEYLVMGADPGTIINTVDGTLTDTDAAVPTTQWQTASSEFTVPAADLAANDHEIHMHLTRVASSAEAASIVVHHVWAEVICVPIGG